jgi:hypothetical protein
MRLEFVGAKVRYVSCLAVAWRKTGPFRERVLVSVMSAPWLYRMIMSFNHSGIAVSRRSDRPRCDIYRWQWYPIDALPAIHASGYRLGETRTTTR